MQRITLDNFRVFGTPAAFDLAPVTVLTGKNNSGKSSLIKAFLVLADYLEQDDQTVLRLDGPRVAKHRISDWNNLRNWAAGNSDTVTLSYTQDGIQFSYEFVGLDSIRRPISLLRFQMEAPGIDRLTLHSFDGGQTYQLDVPQKFINYVANSEAERTKLRETAMYPQRVEEMQQELDVLNEKFSTIDMNGPANEFPRLLEKRQQLEANLANLKELLTEGARSAGIHFQAEISVAHLPERPTLGALIEGALEAYISDNLSLDETYTMAEIAAEYGVTQDENGKPNPEEMARALRDRADRMNQERNRRKLEIGEQEYRTLRRFRVVLEGLNFTVEHLGANRTHQARLYMMDGNRPSEISAVAESFQREGTSLEGYAQAFLERWLPRFDLGDRVKVSLLDNTAVRIELGRGEQLINLADLGFGAGQVLAILLQIAALIQRQEVGLGPASLRYKHKIVLIEEPEANLHPHFQSVLTELFAELVRENSWMQFVIETHSEYLIRNIQVLVKNAGGNHLQLRQFLFTGNTASIKEEQVPLFKVYYLDVPSEANGNLYGHEMRLRADGVFMDEFGEGFLMDESANLAFKLFRS